MIELIKKVVKQILKLFRKPVPYLTAQISYLSPNERLKGKKIIITGGGRGLGEAMTRRFVAEGADVLIVGRDEESLKQTSLGVGCQYIRFDVTDFEHIEDFLKKANKLLGGANVLVNNAGISLHEGDIRNVSFEQFDKQINVNLKSSYFLSQKFLKLYEKNRCSKGSILFVSSVRGRYVDDIPYGLTKAAINSLTQGLSKLLVKNDIRINAVAPGVTASAMTGREVGGNMYAPQYATGRTYQPEEIAEIACFLICDASSCLSGQIIYCDNGNSVNSHRK